MVLLIAAALIATPALPTPGGADAAAVRDVFKAYQTALLRKDGPAAARLLARPTVAYFQRMRDLALTGKAGEIKSLALGDKFTIVRLRVEFPAAQLKRMDGMAVLADSVSRGWVGEGIDRIGIGPVAIAGDHASIVELTDGKVTSERFSLQRENGVWRLDLVPLMTGANAAFKKLAAESGMSEDSFVFAIVEKMVGRPVPVTIWNPPR